ncbi:hypothetical protein EV207_16215 [Scopulibacillus darangshiensis]|uniref:Uncharacterized protein n=1 Tax=Scopulibacillus darangshiensis TaxID=442528 RepID=A0A4R2NE99_9BACL|nr:hypothetical protein [Scopulibacillus darangshiensis]TCP19510.1 hypothetical protein EV207_16215 [Scopulibacillus darangshiensis]
MSDENKKKPKTIHVDKLHIKANEIVIHHEGEAAQGGPRPNEQQQENMQQPPIQRDFWGFPIYRQEEQAEPEVQEVQDGQEENANVNEEENAGENQEANQEGNQEGNQEENRPPFGGSWI